jgi:DNA-binding NarL/FixJ family response regulator
MGSSTTVVVVDDHEVLAESLAMVLDAEPDLTVVGRAATVAAAVRLVADERPDVVLLDVALPDGDGIAAIPQLLEGHPGVRVVVLTGAASDQALLAAVEHGVAGFLSKAGGVRRVVSAVRSAANDEVVLAPAMLDRLLPLMRGERGGEAGPALTERELEVLHLVARGMTNVAIAEELVLSPHTVRNHVASLSRKLGAHSKLEALSIALRRGLVTAG